MEIKYCSLLVALKDELLTLLGTASLVDVSKQTIAETIHTNPNPSTPVLATCFITESNTIISKLYTEYVQDQ
jgi:hypothetical protein